MGEEILRRSFHDPFEPFAKCLLFSIQTFVNGISRFLQDDKLSQNINLINQLISMKLNVRWCTHQTCSQLALRFLKQFKMKQQNFVRKNLGKM